MARKKKNKIDYYLYLNLAVIVLSAISVLMIFFTAYFYADKFSFTGLQASFGCTNENGEQVLKGNFLTLLAFILPIAPIVLTILFKRSPLMALISGVALLGAGIIAFVSVSTFPSTVVNQSMLDFINGVAGMFGSAKTEWQLGAGIIISGITSILASIASFARCLIKK
ncbi:MAG: hypothetical protein IJW26_03415 [Clostridia bacterium]|nr:hypothetical protein [Clostridia bacterium]